jgi:hypothetical protein
LKSHVLGVVLVVIAGCAELESEDALGESETELSVTSWSAPVYAGAKADYGATVATVGSTTIAVRSSCCSNEGGNKDLAWAKRTATGWSAWSVIHGQRAADRVSLAPFNGYIYMIRIGESTNVYISRFNPATNTWSQQTQLPYTSYATPAVAAFQNQLRLVGNRTDSFQMWTATMNTAEVFSTATLIPNHFTSWRPAAAVYNNRLFVAHMQHGSADIVYGTFDGTTWSAEYTILAGTNGAPLRGNEPVLAAVNGFLHLVYRQTYSTTVRWTYMDRCSAWAPEVSIGSLVTAFGFSLAQGGAGLLLTTSSYDYVYVSEFTAPPAPPPFPLPPGCGVIGL